MNVGLNRGRQCSCGAPKSAVTQWCTACWKSIPPIDKYNIVRALENLSILIREAENRLENPRRLTRMMADIDDAGDS